MVSGVLWNDKLTILKQEIHGRYCSPYLQKLCFLLWSLLITIPIQLPCFLEIKAKFLSPLLVANASQSRSFRCKVLGSRFLLGGGKGKREETWGAFHSTKISGNSGAKSNGTEIFRKLVSKISVNLSRLSKLSGNLEIPGISCSIGHFHSVSSSSRPKRWRRQAFSPAIRMFLRFTRHRIISMTHFCVSDATTRFIQFLEEKCLDFVKCSVT